MKVLTLLIAFGATLVMSAPTTLVPEISSKQLQPGAVQISRYIGPSNYPGYYIYNYLQIDQGRGIPIAIITDGSHGLPQVQPTYNYYETPVYDYRYHFNQIYPGLPGFQPSVVVSGQHPSFTPAQHPSFTPGQHPSFTPAQHPSFTPGQYPSFTPAPVPIYPPSTQRPLVEVDDGIEKLDEKVDPSLQGNGHPNDDEDTVTIDAI